MALNSVSRFLLAAGALLGVLAETSTSEAYLVSGSSLSASADFTASGGNLTVTLKNTSAADVLVPSQALTAVFFDIVGVGPLTPVAAGGNVGGEWAYKAGIVGAPGGATEGISSSVLSGLVGQVRFSLSGLPTNFTLSSANVQHVYFQYGTSPGSSGIAVPAPATISLLGVALLGVAAIGRLRISRRKK